jgi:hypothetical protein
VFRGPSGWRPRDIEPGTKWRVHAPRSDWIKELRDAKARNGLLLEAPMPVGKTPKKWAEIAKNLDRFQEHFLNGNYRAGIECMSR